jgi:hypothetical protein
MENLFSINFRFRYQFSEIQKIFTVIITKHRNMLIIDYHMAIFISHVISTGGPRAYMGRGLLWHVI